MNCPERRSFCCNGWSQKAYGGRFVCSVCKEDFIGKVCTAGKNDFNSWHSTHPCNAEVLWYLQNMLGTVYGYESENAKQAVKAWEFKLKAEQEAKKGSGWEDTLR